MANAIIDNYREFYRQNDDVFVENKPACRPSSSYSKYDVASGIGRGWVDMHQIGHGLAVSRGRFVLRSPWRCEYTDHGNSLSLHILLSGKLQVSDAERNRVDEFSGGTVLVRKHCASELCPLCYDQLPNCPLEGVSVELPISLVKELLTDAGRSGSDFLFKAGADRVVLNPGHRCHQFGLQVARTILGLASDSVVGRMRVEAAALNLIAEVCAGGDFFQLTDVRHLPHQHRTAVDEAVSILEDEFQEIHTITSLAHRVRLNECYLKSAFRKITGHTIADFLRRQRMAHARYLIEERQSTVLQAALSVGYSNPSHFTAAFRSVYGVQPSNLKQILKLYQ